MTKPTEVPERDAPVADAVPDNWVDRYAPAATRPYLRLSRADRPIGTWLLLIPCWWGTLLAALSDGRFGLFDLWVMLACLLGAFLMRGAGCTWNDITDRDIDAKVARTKSRPIPSGQVSVTGALIWMAAQMALSLLILLTFPPLAIFVSVASLIFVAIYPFAKRFTWWPQVFLGLAFNWGALIGWIAHDGTFAWPAFALYLGGIAWTLFYDTIYAHQDKEDDALIGVKSTARLFAENSPRWLLGFQVATITLLAVAVIGAVQISGNALAFLIAMGGVWGMGWHMLWQLRQLDIDDGATCLRLFRSNRDTGLIPALFFAVALFL